MAYWTHTVKPIGVFVEKEMGNHFEYSINEEAITIKGYDYADMRGFPHKVWVADGYRLADVKKTVAYVVVDETEYGQPVIEKWQLKKNTKYAV
jgi:hypothetical protein